MPRTHRTRHDPLLAVYVAVGVASAVLESFIYVMATMNVAAAALAYHALYRLYRALSPTAPQPDRAAHNSRRFARAATMILASTIAYFAARLAYRLTS